LAEAFTKRPETGTLLGSRFRLEEVIGVGGMASVWLARDEELHRPVAVKLLSEALAEDREYLVRFGREARTAASVAHPNLVNVFDYRASGSRPYLVMEYVEGGTLTDLIEGGEPLDPARVARELLSALRSIHWAGIIHRDIKPENVLVGLDGRMRLTDFGIAQPKDASRITQTGAVIGTRRFMAPELRAGGDPTVRSDLYSLGVLLRDCLPPGAPAELVEFAAHLSRADPAERPESAAEALLELERATAPAETEKLAGAAPARTVDVPVEPAPAAARRTFVHVSPARVVLAIAAVVGALIVAATVLGDDSGPGRPLLGPEAEPDPPNRDRGVDGGRRL
jgi:serine/threonine protein kinase